MAYVVTWRETFPHAPTLHGRDERPDLEHALVLVVALMSSPVVNLVVVRDVAGETATAFYRDGDRWALVPEALTQQAVRA